MEVSQTLVGKLNPIEESWESRTKIQFSAQGEFRFAMESSEDSVYDTSALMDIILSLPSTEWPYPEGRTKLWSGRRS